MRSWSAGTADTFWRTIKKRPRPHRTPGLTFIMFAMSRPRLNPHHLPALPGSGWPRSQSGLTLPLSRRSGRARLLFLIRPLSSPFFFLLLLFFPPKLARQFTFEIRKKKRKKEIKGTRKEALFNVDPAFRSVSQPFCNAIRYNDRLEHSIFRMFLDFSFNTDELYWIVSWLDNWRYRIIFLNKYKSARCLYNNVICFSLLLRT